MLAELGYKVVEASSGEEGLRLIRNGVKPDVLVTDHLMSGINGTDIARIVRAEQPGVRVLIISGYADVDGVAPDLPRLVKPFRNDELAASLAGLRASARADSANPRHITCGDEEVGVLLRSALDRSALHRTTRRLPSEIDLIRDRLNA